MNVLKQHLQTTVSTLLAAGKSQREIERITGVNRKTIRSLAQRTDADVSNSPGVAIGSDPQITPPRPPTISSEPVSACEPHRAYIEARLRLRRNYTAIDQDPARVRDPNRKGTVENTIQHTQSTALKGRRFESIEEQNAFLERWETQWAALRIHGSVRRQIETMFQEERAHLKPLPLQGLAISLPITTSSVVR